MSAWEWLAIGTLLKQESTNYKYTASCLGEKLSELMGKSGEIVDQNFDLSGKCYVTKFEPRTSFFIFGKPVNTTNAASDLR